MMMNRAHFWHTGYVDLCHTVLEGNSGISENKGPTLWTLSYTLDFKNLATVRLPSQMLLTYVHVHGQCNELVTVVGRQFITLIVYLCVQHDERNAARRAGLSVAAESR